MLPPTPHFERHQEILMQGDIGFFPFAQLAIPSEAASLPADILQPAARGIPAFEGLVQIPLATEFGEYLLRRWHGLGVVIDVTSELMNSPEDSRVTVAALVPRDAVNLSWEAAIRGQLAGVLAIPRVERGSLTPGFPEADWPDMVLSARSLTTVSRGIAESGRMMTLTPRMVALLVAKLSEMFGARQWARMKHFANVEGQVLSHVDDIGKDQAAPTDGKWAVLHFANKERLQVFVSPKN